MKVELPTAKEREMQAKPSGIENVEYHTCNSCIMMYAYEVPGRAGYLAPPH